MKVGKEQLKALVGKNVYAVKRDGSTVAGRLVRISGNRLYLKQGKGKRSVKTSAILPLVLYDLLAVGASPYGYGYGGYGGYSPYPYGSYGGYPYFF